MLLAGHQTIVSEALHPTSGVRILLERQEAAAADAVRYRGAIFTSQARFDFRVDITVDGAVALAPADGSAAEPAAVELLGAMARTVARHALSRQPPEWPRRVLRWRSLRRSPGAPAEG